MVCFITFPFTYQIRSTAAASAVREIQLNKTHSQVRSREIYITFVFYHDNVVLFYWILCVAIPIFFWLLEIPSHTDYFTFFSGQYTFTDS